MSDSIGGTLATGHMPRNGGPDGGGGGGWYSWGTRTGQLHSNYGGVGGGRLAPPIICRIGVGGVGVLVDTGLFGISTSMADSNNKLNSSHNYIPMWSALQETIVYMCVCVYIYTERENTHMWMYCSCICVYIQAFISSIWTK